VFATRPGATAYYVSIVAGKVVARVLEPDLIT
jgi:hypothetical protein